MVRLSIRCTLFFLACGFAVYAQQAARTVADGKQASQTVARLSPVPLYPRDGNIPVEMQDQLVFLDTESWDYVVSYPEGLDDPGRAEATGRRKVFRVPALNQVQPAVSVKITKDPSGKYLYQYDIGNQAGARRPIRSWFPSIPQPFARDPADPASRPDPEGRSPFVGSLALFRQA